MNTQKYSRVAPWDGNKLELFERKSGNIRGAPFVCKEDGQIHSGNNRGVVSSYGMKRAGGG
jgi:hypothetical protein